MTLTQFIQAHHINLKRNDLMPLYNDLLSLDHFMADNWSDLTPAKLTKYFMDKGISVLKYTQGVVPSLCFSEFTFPKDYRLPPDIKKIESNAFEFVDGMERFFAADGLEEIELGAFYECPDLKHIYLPSSVTQIPPGLFTNLPKNKTGQFIIHTPLNSPAWNYAVKWNITRDNLYRYPQKG